MTQLIRNALRGLHESDSAHPGLLLQRGWTDSENEGANSKTEHIRCICGLAADPMYENAYERWKHATADSARFTRILLKIEGRLLIGLTGGGALETGCAVSHSYGMPTLPGSSIKGVVRAWAEKNMPEWKVQFNDLFGTTDLSGLVAFHDAWWIPDSGNGSNKNKPFVADIVTPHHPEYYAGGKAPASDLDSPVPNNLIGVRGSFLFVIEGEAGWRGLAEKMLTKALSENGIGAKTRAGYGYLAVPKEETAKMKKAAAQKAATQTFIRAKLSRNVGSGEIKAILPDGKITVPLRGPAAQALLDKLPEEVRNCKKIKEGKLPVDVAVCPDGNMIQLLDVRPVTE